jgi:hypothetical protein
MRFNQFNPIIVEGQAGNIILAAAKKVWPRVKAIAGGPYLLLWDVVFFTLFPEMADEIEKHWKEKDWFGLALDVLTLRGTPHTIIPALITNMVRNIYDEVFIEGTPIQYPEFKNIPGDDYRVRGHLEQVLVSNPRVATARLKFMADMLLNTYRESRDEALNKLIADLPSWGFTGGGAVTGNPQLTKQAQASARAKLAAPSQQK